MPKKSKERQTNMPSRFYVILVTFIGLAGCGSERTSAKELPASDLTYLVVEDNYEFSLEIDPWLANYPEIVRDIRSQSVGTESNDNCSPSLPCFSRTSWKLRYGGERLVSVISTTTSFYGGAHPSMETADRTYDLKTGKSIRFGEIFSSWPAARKLLQRQWCESLRGRSTCPSIEKQALALDGDSKGASGVWVQTSDYAFGSYVEGTAQAYLGFTPELVALAKPEYQPLFNLDDLCC